MLDRFALPDVVRVSRRTVLGSLAGGVVGLVACLWFDQPWAGLGLCVGLALGISNFRMVQRSVRKVGERMPTNRRRPLAANTLGRMAVITVAALGLLLLLPPLGFGLLGGLALFQALLLANVTRSMLSSRPAPGLALLEGDPGDAAVAGDDLGALDVPADEESG